MKGGARKGSGRKEGSANVKTRKLADQLAEEGLTPLEIMVDEMRYVHGKLKELRSEKNADAQTVISHVRELRELAKDAAPYLHPRLQAMQVSGTDGGAIPVKFVIEG